MSATKKVKGGRKTAKKTAKPALVPQPDGKGALLAGGVPGNKGGSGRPPNWLRDFCDNLLADKRSLKQVEEILRDKDHPAFATMWKTVAERAHGKVTQPIEHNATASFAALVAAAYGGAQS